VKQVESLRNRYLAAVTAARDAAAKANKGGAVIAIEAEIKEANSDAVAVIIGQ
jgi:hypothetical protein